MHQRTLCSRKRRDEDVLEHSKQLIADPLEPTSRARSSFELTFACPTPAYQTPLERAQKQKHNYKLDPTDDKEGIPGAHPVEKIVDRKSTLSVLPIGLRKNWRQEGKSDKSEISKRSTVRTMPVV